MTTIITKARLARASHDVVEHPVRLEQRRDVVQIAGVRDGCNARRQRRDVGRVARVARAEVGAY